MAGLEDQSLNLFHTPPIEIGCLANLPKTVLTEIKNPTKIL